ncbi:chloride intracellular channel protein 1-like isoform X2 [Styela clava]|uniref:chloride intracellular channel protein 1-like isoform X2 n=1 Tax=Styela clava TaxID=7725 RepID=UPI001939FF21|nr:chloride intracellular channel protein 1-like isoform X2 [Styela clava]
MDGKDKRKHVINLYVKAGSDKECIGCCLFSQRLFMLLWLKGVVFNVTTVHHTRVKEYAVGGERPPFMIFNGETLTDIPKCEDYIEAELHPPNYPILACKYAESATVGNDIFAKFSAFIKFNGDRRSEDAKKREQGLVAALRKLDNYLKKPLDHEIDADSDDNEGESTRNFIDGSYMTIADCNMLPKLHIIRIAGKALADFEIPPEFTGIHRYLHAADQTEEFVQTCASPEEIIATYGGGSKLPHKK